MSNTEELTFAQLDLQFGEDIEICTEPGNDKTIFPCKFVGAIPDEAILVTAPPSGLFPRVAEGQSVVMRAKLPNGIALFQTAVLFLGDVPTIMAYLDYPRDINFKQVRKAARVNVALPVLASNLSSGRDETIAGKILDISTTGARVALFGTAGQVGDIIALKGKFKVGQIQRTLALRAVIRAIIGSNGESTSYGVEFHEGDEDQLLVLFGFIFNAMAFGEIQHIQ